MVNISNFPKKQKNKQVKSLNAQFIKQKIKKLKFDISCHQNNIKLLFAFAAGEKRCNHPRLKNYQRTEKDDRQLLKTVACLRAQITRKQQELAILKEVNTDAI